PLIAASGANAVRLYAPILTSNMLDKAWDAGLYVIPTFGVDDYQLSCAAGRTHMQDRFVEMVEEWGDHPAILFWLVGNEVKSYLVQSDLNTDFFPQLDALAAAAQTAEGASAHPVGTAMADVGDVCLDGTSDDVALPNVDLWGTQLYRGCDFGTGAGNAFTQYANKADCDRPLVVTEFGADSWKSMSSCSGGPPTSCFVNSDCPMGTCTSDSAPCNIDTDCSQAPPHTGQTCTGGQSCDGAGMEDQAMQDSCMGTLLSDADAGLAIKAGGVSSGQVVFEWADEWWKAACLTTGGWEFHDTCANTRNNNYTMDPAINEEWFGMVANEAFCSSGSMGPCVSDGDCAAGTCSVINDPDARVNKTAYTNVGNAWLGPVCDMLVDSHVEGGNTTILFDPTAGNAVAHTLYFGDLSDVSNYTGTSYTFLGERPLGATSPSTITNPLPSGSLFWVVAAENGNTEEGCYGTDSAGTERPCSGAGCETNLVAGWNCWCSSP
ncbi:MAG: hypothetical protein OEQ13_02140, partial [Acidobacteriota bacterium]|nr:hypothetical protein [Acidobacteriota bacterium]